MEGKCWDHRQLAKADGTRAVGGGELGRGLGGIHFTLSDSCSHSITVHKHVCKNVGDYVGSSVYYANFALNFHCCVCSMCACVFAWHLKV